jgi:beta-glucanase (GH16 family)
MLFCRSVTGLMIVLVSTVCSVSCQKSKNVLEPPAEPQITEGGPPERDQWKILFRDDFTGTTLDRSKWDPYYTWGRRGTIERHHNYDAWALDENVTVENGLLRLKCEPDRRNAHDYTYSTGVVTATYLVCRRGYYYEAKMKIPHGWSDAEYTNGLWPAFWLTGRGTWPPEIDIHEFFGCNTHYHATIHSTDESERGTNIQVQAPDATSEFNIYAVHWREDDKVEVYFNNRSCGTLNEPDPYREKVLIINFGIHGPKDEQNWLGNASWNVFPQYYETDWVRVWQKK